MKPHGKRTELLSKQRLPFFLEKENNMPDMDENSELKEIEFLKKEIEVLKKRVDYFYNEISPYIQIANCKRKHAEVDNNNNVVKCYENHPCSCCSYNETISPDDRFEVTEKGKEYLSSY